MIIKRLFLILFGLMAVTVIHKNAHAAYLVLTRIGTMPVSGQIYSSWTYIGPSSPDFAGIASPGAVVAVTVNAITASTSAAIDGSWVVVPTNIVPGTNSVAIASGNELVAFSLVFSLAASSTPTPSPTATPSALPEAGVMVWPLGLVAIGLVIFFTGRGVRDRIDEHYS